MMRSMTLLVSGLVLGAAVALADGDLVTRVRAKAAEAEAAVARCLERGGDPGPAVELLREVRAAGERGELERAEALLDRALALLRSPDGPGAALEPATQAWAHPRPVEVRGYDGDVMEPFLTRDGSLLLFNDLNDPGVDTNLHLARRVDALTFRYLGPLTGANSPALDAVPSVDRSGRAVFVTTRSYDRDLTTLYGGRLQDERLVDARPLSGDVTPGRAGWLNMDAELSADGETLFFTMNDFSAGGAVPTTSELRLAARRDGRFVTDPRSAAILARVNSVELDYAPASSADGLELFWTRADVRPGGRGPRILTARRSAAGEPYGEPRRLAAIQGFAEAPTVDPDGRRLYYPARVGGRMRLYTVERAAD